MNTTELLDECQRSIPVEPVSDAAVVVKTVPVGDLVATPGSPTDIDPLSIPEAQLLLTEALRYGTPCGYLPEHGGDIVQNLVPVRANAHRQTSTSSAVDLELHTEAGFHPGRPRHVALLCLRSHRDAATTFVSATDIVDAVDSETLAQLQRHEYTTGVDESYWQPGTVCEWRTEPHPILWQVNGQWRVRFDADLTAGITPAATAGFTELVAMIRELQKPTVLQPGDLAVFDNEQVIHGRTRFTPKFDGTDRWLLRTFIVDQQRQLGDPALINNTLF